MLRTTYFANLPLNINHHPGPEHHLEPVLMNRDLVDQPPDQFHIILPGDGRLFPEEDVISVIYPLHLSDLIRTIDQYIYWYNHHRIKLTLGGYSPIQFRLMHQHVRYNVDIVAKVQENGISLKCDNLLDKNR